MNIVPSPVAVTSDGVRFRPKLEELCTIQQLCQYELDVLQSPLAADPLTAKVFDALHRLPQRDGKVHVVDFHEAPVKTGIEATVELLANPENWKVSPHAFLNTCLPWFAHAKQLDLFPELHHFMVSTTVRSLDVFANIANGTARIAPHTWDSAMIAGDCFALIDLDNGTYFAGSVEGRRIELRPGSSLVHAYRFAEEEAALAVAKEIAEYYPNIALACVVQTVQPGIKPLVSASHHERVDANLARFSHALIERGMEEHSAHAVVGKARKM